jgi:hypothetical protein
MHSGSDSEEMSEDQARAAIDLATEALSKRIIDAVEEISNPKSNAPKATKQLAAKMAKIIVEAAASKDASSSNSIRTFSYTNHCGEEFQLTVDASGKNGIVAGDETDWENLHIKNDSLQSDFMFNREELAWLRKSWQSATGRELKHPSLNIHEIMLQSGMFHNAAAATQAPKGSSKKVEAKKGAKKK